MKKGRTAKCPRRVALPNCSLPAPPRSSFPTPLLWRYPPLSTVLGHTLLLNRQPDAAIVSRRRLLLLPPTTFSFQHRHRHLEALRSKLSSSRSCFTVSNYSSHRDSSVRAYTRRLTKWGSSALAWRAKWGRLGGAEKWAELDDSTRRHFARSEPLSLSFSLSLAYRPRLPLCGNIVKLALTTY